MVFMITYFFIFKPLFLYILGTKGINSFSYPVFMNLFMASHGSGHLALIIFKLFGCRVQF